MVLKTNSLNNKLFNISKSIENYRMYLNDDESLTLASLSFIDNYNNHHHHTTPLSTSILITDLNNLTNSSTTSFDKEKFLEERLGARKRDIGFVIGMSTIYILILICGLFGNISTCCVIICNNCMHTTTNYYLFSLAVSDVLSLLIGLPVELHALMVGSYPWVFGQTFCILRTFIFETTTIASVLTILTFTCERWLHICKAIYAKKFSSGFSRALKIIVFIWSLSGLLAMPYAFTTGVFDQIDNYPESKLCNIVKDYSIMMNNVIKISVLLLFIVPMTLISIMYILIGITLWKSQTKHRSSPQDRLITRKFRKILGKRKEKDTISNRMELNSDMTQSNLQIKTGDTLMVKNLIPRNMSDFSVGDVSNFANTYSNHDRASKEFEHISYRARQSRRDVVKMLFVVVLGFFICWAPFHFQRLWTVIADDSDKTVLEFIYYISGVSIYISSTINPILYNVMSKRYRTAFKNTLKMICSCSCSKANNKNSSLYYNKNSAISFSNANLNGSRIRIQKVQNM